MGEYIYDPYISYNAFSSDTIHWLSWTNFHNLYVRIDGPTNVVYLSCNQQQQTNILLTARAFTGTDDTGVGYGAGTYDWSVIAGADRVQMDATSSNNVVKITPKAASQDDGDVMVTVTFTTPYNISMTATQKLTVLTPGDISKISSTPVRSQEFGGGLRSISVYQVMDQHSPPRPLKAGGLPVTEQFNEAPPQGCDFSGGNSTTSPSGGFSDTNQVGPVCRRITWEPRQTLKVDCVQKCHTVHYLSDGIETDDLDGCP